MLILARKLNQSIVIDGQIEIMVLGFEHNRVKLGINAPSGITVLRKELLEDCKDCER